MMAEWRSGEKEPMQYLQIFKGFTCGKWKTFFDHLQKAKLKSKFGSYGKNGFHFNIRKNLSQCSRYNGLFWEIGSSVYLWWLLSKIWLLTICKWSKRDLCIGWKLYDHQDFYYSIFLFLSFIICCFYETY